MRSLLTAPRRFIDASLDEPAYGSYAGPLPPITLGKLGLRDRVARRKKWIYLALASDAVWISIAVVRTGYATTAFAFAFDRIARRMLVDETRIAPPSSASVADDLHADGVVARLSRGRTHASAIRRPGALVVEARFGALALEATLDESKAPPPIAAIARLGEGLTSATEKRALTAVRGRATIAGRSFSLDDAVGGYDYTHGLLPRHTKWRWGFAMGRTANGEPFAFNVVEGFVGEAECAAFYAGAVHAIPEPRFTLDPANPERPWRLDGDGIALSFEAGAVHRQDSNLLLVRSRFIQPVGLYRGTMRIGGEVIELEGLPGVAEDQDVLW